MSPRVDSNRCVDVLDRLDAWIDGDLDDAEADSLKTHVDRCESCRAERRLAEEVAAELRAMPDFELPERVLQTVRRKTQPTLMERSRVFFEGSTLRPATAVVALAVVVVMVLLISPRGGPTGPRYTDQEITRATEETKLALAYVGSITRRAELRVTEKIFDDGVATQTVSAVRRSLQIIGGAAAATADLPATPLPHAKGS
jgi:anti-sigma factor RsiW